ncbi:MAG TPA: site-specific integrase, partial [Azospirillum sp.]|nr:site-specific integrase [Azospirillum sp.]
MTVWPDPDRIVIARYLGTLRLRSASSRRYCRQVLCGFQDVVEKNRDPGISRQTVEAWLREWQARWHPSTLLRRAAIVGRFLDHLVDMGVIAGNPIAVLRGECRVPSSQPIWRALASPDPDRALAALHQPRPFGSVLGGLMRDHVALMRSRGYRYKTQAAWFLRFDRFLQAHPDLAREPVAVMLERWSAARSTRNHAAECERLGRALARARRHLDPSIPLPRPDPRPQHEVARQWRQPHIYSPADVRRILDVAQSYPSPRAPLRPLSLYTMLVLAYCAGLRRSELAHLNLGDVDLPCGTITIRETKFFKSRILPLPDTVMAELRAYLDARRRAKAPQEPQSGLFWHEQGNARYTPAAVGWLLVDTLRRAGLKPPCGRTG